MKKVFLVEDEFIIREAVRKTVNWEKEGFTLVGEAGDGEKAYPMIMETKPDILITDIRMPFMDGLELSKLVRESLPRTKIIILSGYDDFSYAREAISIGVTEYLLKPVTGAKLLETLKKVGRSIEEEQEKENYRAIYEKEHEERMQLERSEFLKNLISGKYSMKQVMEGSRELGMHVTAGFYQIILFQSIAEQDRRREKTENPGNAIGEEVSAMQDVLCYEQLGGTLCILVTGPDQETLSENREAVYHAIRKGMDGQRGYIYFTSIGPAVERISEIRQSYHYALQLFARRFLYEESHEFTYGEEGKDGGDNRNDSTPISDKTTAEFWQMDRSYILNFLASGDAEDAESFCHTIVRNVGVKNLSSFIFRQYIMMDVFLTCSSYLSDCGYAKDEIEDACGKFDPSMIVESASEVEEYLRRCLTSAIMLRDKSSDTKSVSLIQEAQQYINRHYMENDISLSKVAGAIGVTPNHLSHMFSQKTGHTFVEYLTQIRMDRAKELMQKTDLTSAEIGLRVGYSDAHYFYYIFKKTLDMTPKEYRSQHTPHGGQEQGNRSET